MTGTSGHPAWCAAVLLAGAALLGACSGIKTYPNDLPKNLRVTTEATSGSAFSSMRVALHIHQVDAGCRTEYQGTVELNEPSIGVGIPSGRMSLLIFTFSGSSFLGGTSSSTRYETLLQPRAGYTYDARARYRDGIYHVEIRESGPRQPGREVERKGLADCGRPA
jgi:hypothetical protein